jgi:hypothetical protein
MAEYKDSIQALSVEEQQILDDLRPLNLRINSDTVANTLTISLYGDFVNTESLNRTFKTFGHENKIAEKVPSVRIIENASRYFWNGKTMKREIDPDILKKLKDAPEQNKELMDILSDEIMIVKYHFPKKVKNISNPNAMLSQDEKTVIIEYPVADFINSSEKINIEITIE